MGLYFVPWFALWERVLKALGWNNSIGSQESFPHTGYQACKADSHSDVSSCDTFPILIMWQILILVTQVWGEGHALLSQVLKKQQFMHNHLFWIVIVKFNVGFTRVWDWDENAYFHTWWWAPWPFDFKLFLQPLGKDPHCLKPVILQTYVEQHVILLVNTTKSEEDCHLFNPAYYLYNLLSDWHGSYVQIYGAWCTPDITQLVHVQTELQHMCCTTRVQNESYFHCMHKSVAQWIPYAINLSGCASTL